MYKDLACPFQREVKRRPRALLSRSLYRVQKDVVVSHRYEDRELHPPNPRLSEGHRECMPSANLSEAQDHESKRKSEGLPRLGLATFHYWQTAQTEPQLSFCCSWKEWP